MDQISSFLSDPIVAAYIQTISGIIVGIAAIWIAIRANRSADKQFKSNQSHSEIANKKLYHQLEQVSNNINQQQEIGERQLNALRNITKPILSCEVVAITLIRRDDLTDFNIKFNVKNIGRRHAKNIEYGICLIGKKLQNHSFDKHPLIEKLYPEEEYGQGHSYFGIEGKYRFLNLTFTFEDEETKTKEIQDYYFTVIYEQNNNPIQNCSSEMRVKIKDYIKNHPESFRALEEIDDAKD